MGDYENIKEISTHYDIRSDIAFNLIHDGFDTIEKIDSAPDERLLRVTKVGQAVLKALRGDNTLGRKWRCHRWPLWKSEVSVERTEEPVVGWRDDDSPKCIDCAHATHTNVQVPIGYEPYPDCQCEMTKYCWCSVNGCLLHNRQAACMVFRERSADDYKVEAEPKRELVAEFVADEFRVEQHGFDCFSEIDATDVSEDFALLVNMTNENAAKLIGNRLHAKVWAEEPLCR